MLVVVDVMDWSDVVDLEVSGAGRGRCGGLSSLRWKV